MERMVIEIWANNLEALLPAFQQLMTQHGLGENYTIDIFRKDNLTEQEKEG